MVVRIFLKNSVVNDVDPMGCLRRQKPEVSLTGMGGAFGEVVEMVVVLEEASVGSEVLIDGRGEVLLLGVSILAVVVLTVDEASGGCSPRP
jgi:predicted aspartyl protease